VTRQGLLPIAVSRVVPCAATKIVWPRKLEGSLVHDGQRPGPAGELTGDGDVRHDGLLATCGEPLPALVQPLVALVASDRVAAEAASHRLRMVAPGR